MSTLLQNRYRVLRHIGGGGMGVVYLAEDTRLPGRHCAVKEMSPEQLVPKDRTWATDAFRQEAQMLATLSHPGLTAVTDFFTEGGNWYLVVDYVEGETLESRLKARGGRLPLSEALDITRQLCDVLEYLHRQNPPVVFRDLKPSNVMVTPQGEVKLIDFGIARFFKPGRTQDTVNLGTPGYAAPELYGGLGQSDVRADVYSLGALLLQMVTGYDPVAAATPFPLPQPGELMHELPERMKQVISRSTQLQPAMRHQSVDELRRALFAPEVVRTTRVQPSPYVLPAQRPRRLLSAKLIGVGIGGLFLLGLCGFAAVWLSLQLVSWQSKASPVTDMSPTASLAVQGMVSTAQTVQTMQVPSLTPLGLAQTPSLAAVSGPGVTSEPTSTHTAIRSVIAYHPVPLVAVVNASLGFESPPIGDVTLGGVPFYLTREIFTSQASSPPHNSYPTSVTLSMDVPQVYRIHLLLNTGNGFKEFDGRVIGQVIAHCNGARLSVVDLRLGQDVREWHSAPNVVSSASRARQVWSGPLADFPDLMGQIDMLSLDLPAACQDDRAPTLEIVDSSVSTVGSLDPALNLVGVTAEYILTEPLSTPTSSCTAVTGPFAGVWDMVQGDIGCPATGPIKGLVVEENFEGGKMFWREPIDYAQALVVFNDGTWRIYEHSPFVEGNPEFPCVDEDTPPRCPPTPRRGFGAMWCDIAEIRQRLGNATDCERGYQGTMQQFEHGSMLLTDGGVVCVFYGSGYWERR